MMDINETQTVISRDQGNGRKRFVSGLKLSVSILILFYLFKLIDYKQALDVLKRIDLSLAWFAPILLICAVYFAALRWSFILGLLSVSQKASESFCYYLVGSFYNVILPGAIGGDVVRIAMSASARKRPVADIASTVLLERISGVFIVLFFAWLSTFFLTTTTKNGLGPSTISTLSLFAALGAVGILSLGIALRYLPFPSWTGAWWQSGRILPLVAQGFKKFREIPLWSFLVMAGFSACFQGGDILASIVLAKSLNIALQWQAYFFIIPFVYLMTLLPISLGGLGVREGTLIYFLAHCGISNSEAVLLAFLIYFNRVIVGIIGGIVQVCLSRRSVSRTAECL